jgi:hypothetical protein
MNGAETAREFEYWNAAGVLIVHAAIAYADAVSIKFGGVKSQGENHYECIELINELVADSTKKKTALYQLQRIIDHKTTVSYSGEVYDKKDIDQLWKQVDRFKEWAETMLEN